MTPEQLSELLDYDPATGILTWRERARTLFPSDREHLRWNGRYAGMRAFTVNSRGYRDGMIFRKMHRAHQVAWAIYYGAWPDGQIDHINGDRDDNRIGNLRVVTRSANCRNTKRRSNNSSGIMGVSPLKGRWRAYIRDDGKNVHLGIFNTLEEAATARKDAEQRLGYHSNHGRDA
jgi:hypothetical protein